LLFALMAALVLVTGTAFAIHYFQKPRIARALLFQAKHAEEQGQTEVMVRFLRRYLEFQPRDFDEKAHLAKTLAGDHYAGNRRRRAEAVRLLDEVVTHDPGRADLRRLLVRCALEIGDYKRVREHLTVLCITSKDLEQWKPLDGTPDHDAGEIEGYLGQLIEQGEMQDQRNKAIPHYREAIRLAEDEPGNYVRLAYLLRNQTINNPKEREARNQEADDLLDQLVEKNKGAYQGYLARWRYRRDWNRIALPNRSAANKIPLDKAAEDVISAKQRAESVIDVQLACAEMERLQGRREEARKHLKRGLELQAQRHILSDPAQFQLLWHLTNLLLDEAADPTSDADKRAAALNEAEQRLAQLRKTRGMPAAAEYLDARLLLTREKWADAVVVLLRIRPVLEPNRELANQINLYLGECYEHLQELSHMEEAYKRVAEADPDSAVGRLGLAYALEQQGRLDDAMVHLRFVEKQGGIPDRGWIDLARMEVQRQLLTEELRRKWEDAERYLKKAEEVGDTPAAVALLRAEIALARHQPADAESILTKARDAEPKQGKAVLWGALVDLALRGEDHGRVVAVLADMEKALGDTVEVRLTKARILLVERPDKVTEKLLELEAGLTNYNDEDQTRLLRGLAEAQLRTGGNREARRLIDQLAERPQYTGDLRLRLLQFDLAVKAHDPDGMSRTLEAIRAIERDGGPYHRYGEAVRLIALARRMGGDRNAAEPHLNEASKLLDQIAAQRQSWAPLYLARAEIAEQRGKPDVAVGELQKAVQQGEQSPLVLHRLITGLFALGRSAEAQAELRKLKRLQLMNSPLGLLAAGAALERKNAAEALEFARQAVPEDSKNLDDILGLAEILRLTGEATEAERNLRKAMSLAPAKPEPYLALVRFFAAQAEELRKADKKTEAEQAMKKAETVLDDIARQVDPSRRLLTRAIALEILGKTDDARTAYDAALKDRSQDAVVVRNVTTYLLRTGQLSGAETQLKRFVDGQIQCTSDDTDWARRSLALLLSAGTDYDRFKMALDLVGLKLDENGNLLREKPTRPDTTEEMRTKARVLATQPQKQFRDRAIELLETLDRNRALTPDDQFVLALLYDQTQAWPKSRERLESLRLQPSPTPHHLAVYAQALIRNGEKEQAVKCIEMLERLEKERRVEPGTFATVDLRARSLEAEGKGDQAVTLLRAYADRKDAPKEDRLMVVNSLIRQRKFPEAFELLEAAWTDCRPEVVGGMSVALLRTMKPAPTNEQCKRVEAKLKAAIDKEKDKTVLRLHLADLHDQRGDYQAALAEYRTILDKEPYNFVALNNLAWLLSEHKGESKEALELINKALAGLGRRADLLDTRGLVYLRLNRTAEAVADLKAATADSPSAARYFHLARAHQQNRERSEALKAMQEAKRLKLEPDELHPLEQQTCRTLLVDLGMKP
jgi:tetratricopeptide (TPR) repeat protein